MYMLFMLLMLSMMIPLLLLMLLYILSTRSQNDREKLSPFECGFDPNHSARTPFSMRFFLLAIIFIVFDIEIVLLIPTPMIIKMNTPHMLMMSMYFLLILLIGLIHEWNQESLNWSN